jgi:predicted kinase
MPILEMLKGLPASGKTTYAREVALSHDWKRVSKDDLRAMLDNGKWSKNNEKFVLAVRESLIGMALQRGLHVVVDDTNFAPSHEEKLRQLAKLFKAEFRIRDFSHVPVETCIERDQKRQNYVGEKVIRAMYNKYLAPKIESYPAMKLPSCIIVDIDGTVAERVDRGPYEWDKVGGDSIRWPVMRTVAALACDTGARIVFMSGRDSVCFEETREFLKKRFPYPIWDLRMRAEGDTRRDSIVKRELFDAHIAGKYDPIAVFDDRAQVCRELWKPLGLGDRLFRVGVVDEDDF